MLIKPVNTKNEVIANCCVFPQKPLKRGKNGTMHYSHPFIYTGKKWHGFESMLDRLER